MLITLSNNQLQFKDRYFMSIDILKTGVIKMRYSPYTIHSRPLAINLLYNSLLRENYYCNGCKITLKSLPLVNSTKVIIII